MNLNVQIIPVLIAGDGTFVAPEGLQEVYDTAGTGVLHAVNFSVDLDDPRKYKLKHYPSGKVYLRFEGK